MRFRGELHNRSDRLLILFLGWNQPQEIRLSLTDAHGRTLPLELPGHYHLGAGGPGRGLQRALKVKCCADLQGQGNCGRHHL
jgi:hypothetical protein